MALNILQDINCLALSAYQIAQLRAVPDFTPHRLSESGLFKVPQLDTTTIFYLERSDDDGSLIHTIERHELTGLRLEQVWSSVEGLRPINLITDAPADLELGRLGCASVRQCSLSGSHLRRTSRDPR